MASFEDQLDVILKHEGKFQKWRQDRGNWHRGRLIGTNFGIVPAALAKHRGVYTVTEAQMRALTVDEAKDIYRAQYYNRAKIGLLPNQIEYKVFDMCVNHGVHGGVKLLQRAIARFGYDIAQDGRIGPETVRQAYACVKRYGPRALVNKMVEVRNAYYEAIIRGRPSQARFRRGWLRRSRSFWNTADVAFEPETKTDTVIANQNETAPPGAQLDEDLDDVDVTENLIGVERVAEVIIRWFEGLVGRSKQA